MMVLVREMPSLTCGEVAGRTGSTARSVKTTCGRLRALKLIETVPTFTTACASDEIRQRQVTWTREWRERQRVRIAAEADRLTKKMRLANLANSPPNQSSEGKTPMSKPTNAPRPDPPTAFGLPEVTPVAKVRLAEEAARRGITPEALMVRLVNLMHEEDLWRATMDDGY